MRKLGKEEQQVDPESIAADPLQTSVLFEKSHCVLFGLLGTCMLL